MMWNIFSWMKRRPLQTQFQILSDLHLEVGQQYLTFDIPVAAQFLILAGDIGRLIDYDGYLGFLQKQTERYEKVFLVLGNHEFYNIDFIAGLDTAKRFESEPSLKGRLILLHQSRYDLNSEITVLGCTLWSKVPDEAKDAVESRVNDFRMIENWSVITHNEAHNSDLAWLKEQAKSIQQENAISLASQPKRIAIVITHHAPSTQGTSDPKYKGSPWNSAFATDVLSEGTWKHVKYWIFGHTHYSTKFVQSGVNVVSNQRGYVLPSSKPLDKQGENRQKDLYSVTKTIQV